MSGLSNSFLLVTVAAVAAATLSAPAALAAPPSAPAPIRPEAVVTPLSSARAAADARTVRPATEFSLVGVRWTGAAPDLVEVRNRSTDGSWSDWTELEATDPQREVGRENTTTEPIWTGPSTEVQVRAERAGRPVTNGLEVVTIDPGTSPADARAADAAVAAVPGAPAVVPRSAWGADENLMTWAPEYASTTKAVTIHHTAGTNDYTCGESASVIRGIYYFHAVTRGWGDIGYNVLVDKCGTLFEGRKGGLDLPTIGAHAGGFNTYTFGISMMGEFGASAPPAATQESVAQFAAWKLATSYRDPLGSTVLVSTGGGTSKYPAGTAVTLPTIFAHRDVGNTECPGNGAYGQLGNIRSRVATLAGDWRSSPIYTRWQELGGEAGPLGGVYQQESALPGGGRGTSFLSGFTITDHPTAGVRVIKGFIRERWLALGGANYGYPTTDEVAITGGAYSELTNDRVIYWSPASGAHGVGGVFKAEWLRNGGVTGVWGFPVSDEYVFDGKQRQDFQKTTMFYNPATGAITVIPRRGSL